MSVLVSIGDFSRMTHLSIKALRFYHDQGLLEPARIDPGSGYRFYEPAQVPVAQVIRRFRDLDMPLDQVKAVLQEGRIRALTISAVEAAVMVHAGPLGDADQTYGLLGTVVAERAIGVDGPIREYYLVPFTGPDPAQHRTEICWPVFHTAASGD
ncbi:MAG TPA: MerR family transcriptional regulator [Streptosporangiaceae bacterium]|nr:MerR family transcriptional regulator [Streptosporangiaceae bacterium]